VTPTVRVASVPDAAHALAFDNATGMAHLLEEAIEVP
jgi:hypothetical protein